MEGENASVPFYLDKIQESITKLENFTTEVLDHSRSGRKEIMVEPVELISFFNEILENLKYVQGFDRIKFNFQLDVSVVNTDRFLLKVAISNILSNAIKYQKQYQEHMPEVKIVSRQQNNLFEIHIEDNGEGIRDDIKEKVFDMFYRASAQSSGSGLGLYIARESIEKLKGSLSLESKFGEGSLFKITLPIRY
jgi:signal transduction histidine kinase